MLTSIPVATEKGKVLIQKSFTFRNPKHYQQAVTGIYPKRFAGCYSGKSLFSKRDVAF